MKTTANLGFKKPEGTDVVNIEDLNYNADIADIEIVKKASSTQDGRMAKEDKVKFDGMSAGANKVEQSSTNGNIKIDGVEKKVYTPPTGTNPYGTTKADVGLGNVTNDAQVKRTEMGANSGVATLDVSGVNAQAPKAHTHPKSQISDFPTSMPANGGNAATATKLQTARKINGTDFDGSSDITITASANGGNSTTVNNHTANGTPSTTEKTDIIKMINEVFQSGTNVKSDAISAVNSKGGSLGSDATWDDIIAAINAIARGQGDAVESQVLSGIKFSNSDGQLRTGTMPNKGAVTLTPGTTDQTISNGYHNGSGIVKGEPNLIASNLVAGKSYFGITGSATIESLGGKKFYGGSTTQSRNDNNWTVWVGDNGTSMSFTPSVILIKGMTDSDFAVAWVRPIDNAIFVWGTGVYNTSGVQVHTSLPFDSGFPIHLSSTLSVGVGIPRGSGSYTVNFLIIG